jgi:predicted nucleic acid-binding protein
VTSYPDTSFLCALYRPQFNSVLATEYFAKMKEPLHVASPLLFEFRQSLRFQSFLHSRDRSKGFAQREASAALAKLDENLADGFLQTIPVDWADIVSLADRLSARHTPKEGTRGFDILHVATALHLGAQKFLTFDSGQKRMALAEGLKVPF